MFLSVTHRIIGPIALLILIGAAATTWITREAVRTHEELQSQEERAYDFQSSVERAKDAFKALEAFSGEILSFNRVMRPRVLESRYQALHDTLAAEIAQIRQGADTAELAKSVEVFVEATEAWKREARIALGLTDDRAIPTVQRLDQLRVSAENALVAIYGAAKSGAIQKTGETRQLYKSRVDTIFFSMLAMFAVFGIFFLIFGRRLARALTRIARSMERIRRGEYEPGRIRDFSQDEIGKIAQGVEAFGETLQALRKANEKVRHLAMHDQLTGLSNRRALEERLEELLSEGQTRISQAAILHVDLDRFKQVNDMFGHAAGDEILRHASKAMNSHTRQGDMVARIGGDEFILLLTGLVSEDAAASVAERVIDAISQPIEIWTDLVNVGASIGIAFLGDCEGNVERLLANADMALYIAKGAGRGRHSFYSAETRRQFETDMSLLRELRTGLDSGQIIAYFQPKVDAANNELLGFEALARWAHPTRGILGPGEFIGLAFENGLGDRLSDTIVREAINALLEWRNQGLKVPGVSVNFSAKQLRDSGLTEYLDDALLKAGLLPRDITVEVLESVLFGDDVDPAHATIAQLKRRGYRIELDDFGTGHASISNLRKFKVDGVKLDRVFVTGVDSDPEQEMILRTLIDLCRNLDITCLAEGVETDGERSKLLALGCSNIQGYCIAKPMAREDVADWVGSQTRNRQRPRAV